MYKIYIYSILRLQGNFFYRKSMYKSFMRWPFGINIPYDLQISKVFTKRASHFTVSLAIF